LCVHELRTEHPVLNLRVLGNPTFALGTGLITFLIFAHSGALVLMPLFTQQLMGYTPYLAGLALAPGSIASIAAMPLVGKLTNRIDSRFIIGAGCALLALSMHELGGMTLDASFAQVVWPRLVQGVGYSFVFISLSYVALSAVPKEQTSDAAALYNFARHVGSGCGVATLATFLERAAQRAQVTLTSHVTPFDPRAAELKRALTGLFLRHGADRVTADQRAWAALYGVAKREALLQAFLDSFVRLSLLFLLVIPMLMFLRAPRPAGEPPEPEKAK
jgi:DHA2 family multidrug resistance protein